MIIKTENTYPKVTFLTTNGNRTPKEIWLDQETGIRGMTKKDVQSHIDRLLKLGITNDMTEEETIEHLRKRRESVI